MVGTTRADLIARIGAMTTPEITEGKAAFDFGGMANNFMQGMNQGKKLSDFVKENNAKNAYLEALETGDQDAIDKAYASYDPMGYAKMVRDREASDLQYERNKELADIAFQRRMQLEGIRQGNARSLKSWELGLKEQAAQEADEQSKKQAQDAINQLYDVAKRGNIGVFTDWRRKHGLTDWIGNDVENDLGAISSAVAGVAPRAIAKLKAAGVSGINTKGEFLQYIGLPENPTSQQLIGALPMMAQIAGVENPIPEKSLKQFNNNSANAPMIDIGSTQNFGNGFTVTRTK